MKQLQRHSFMYADQLPTLDSICGTFHLHPSENSFYETLENGTALRYELTSDGRLLKLEDLSEVGPSEVLGSAVGHSVHFVPGQLPLLNASAVIGHTAPIKGNCFAQKIV
ncbi:hypothetical protein N9087_00795 [bacterium]|nr:hypothetical protein [bacterium]